MLSRKQSKIFGGSMLIAGTSIGGAMLAMPILTGLFGFMGTLVIMMACWLFMYWTALLILEASLQFDGGVSFITMAKKTLGPLGSFVTWLTFLLLFYSLVSAYLSGSGHIIVDGLEHAFRLKLPALLDVFPLLVLFAPFIYFGLSAVDYLNRYLMIAMFITYGLIVFLLLPNINMERLVYTDWSFSLLSFSVVVTSFGYHVIIPTLVTYLDQDVKAIKTCLFYGSIIPLIIYSFWEIAILGTINTNGANGLAFAFANEVPLVKLLRIQLKNDFITFLGQGFSMFAIVTSFLGVAQGLFDFLKDGLKARGSHKLRILAFILTFFPPLLLIIFLERGFITLLEYAGALVSIILGIIPMLIVWRLRMKRNIILTYRAPGGKLALSFGILFFVFVVMLVILKNIGIISFNISHLL